MKFRSTALHIATLVFKFIVCIRFLVSDSLIGVLKIYIYAHDLAVQVRTLRK